MSEVTIETLLGGYEVIGHSAKTDMDLYEISRNGLPKKALLHLAANLKVSLRALSQLLNVAERTIQRKADQDLLDSSTTEQVLQLAEVFSRGQGVFGSSTRFQQWINTGNLTLGGKRPMELLQSRFGMQMVLDELGRIEYGIVS
jgi:putative toxin-antitoxin system antitoxin component (TIGR02293 family)